jgi:hypothetical protein
VHRAWVPVSARLIAAAPRIDAMASAGASMSEALEMGPLAAVGSVGEDAAEASASSSEGASSATATREPVSDFFAHHGKAADAAASDDHHASASHSRSATAAQSVSSASSSSSSSLSHVFYYQVHTSGATSSRIYRARVPSAHQPAITVALLSDTQLRGLGC